LIMYSKSFYIKQNIWNNSFSFEKRTHPLTSSLLRSGNDNPKLYVPKLIKINNFSEIKLLNPSKDKITFEDFWFDWKLSTNFWLENFYEITPPSPPLKEGINCPIFLFDNHNHALFFWYLAREKWLIAKKNNILYHIDEHADYREPKTILEKNDLQSIFNYTNFFDINVWNYIIPAEKEWLIWKTIQIRSTKNLEDYLKEKLTNNNSSIIPFLKGDKQKKWIILNLDLDFFQPDLDFIDYNLKKKVILDLINKADFITVSTSPFFIDQNLAIKVFKDIIQSFYKL